MRKTDIEVGKSYRAKLDWPLYGAKVRVLDKEIPMPHGRKQPGIRVQVERAVGRSNSYFRAEQDQLYTVQSRKLAAPWTDQDDCNGAYMHRGGIVIEAGYAEAVLDKLGVPR